MKATSTVCLLLLCGSASAQEADGRRCPAPASASPALAEVPGHKRLRFLQEEMRGAARRSRAWAAAWGATYGALLLTNTALLSAFYDDPGQRIDFAFGLGSSALGVALIAIRPPAIIRDQRRLAQLGSGGDLCAALALAERLLLRDARDDAFGKGPLLHAGNVIFNLGLGAVLALGLGRRETALGYVLGGTFVGELMTLTRPADSVAIKDRYLSGQLGALPEADRRLTWTIAPHLSGQGAGVVLTLSR